MWVHLTCEKVFKAALVGVIICKAGSELFAQNNFIKTFNLPGFQSVESIVQVEDHHFLLVGSSQRDDQGMVYSFVAKADASGNIVWKKYLNNPLSSYNVGSQSLFADGKYIVLSSGLGMMVSTLSENGDLLSHHIFSDSIWSAASMDLSLENGLIIASEQTQQNSLLNDIILAKADLTGKVYWAKRYGTAAEDERPFKILQLENGDFLVAGVTSELSEFPNYENILLLRISQQGDIVWKKIYGGVEQNVPGDIIKTQDGSYVIIAFNQSAQGMVEIMKLDDTGQFLWANKISTEMMGVPREIVETETGEFLVIGERIIPFNTPPEPPRSTLLWGFSKNGVLRWQREYAIDPRYSSGYAIAKTDDGEFLASGRVTNGADVDFYLLKIGDDGCMLKRPNLGRDTTTCANAIRLDAGSGFTSYSWSTGETSQLIDARKSGSYSVEVGGANTCVRGDSILLEFKDCVLFDRCQNIGFSEEELVFPNVITPNSDSWNEFFQIPKALSGSRLVVFNRWGKSVYQNEHYADEWRGDGLSAGTYYYLVESDCFDAPVKGYISILR